MNLNKTLISYKKIKLKDKLFLIIKIHSKLNPTAISINQIQNKNQIYRVELTNLIMKRFKKTFFKKYLRFLVNSKKLIQIKFIINHNYVNNIKNQKINNPYYKPIL